jgi:large subunit ribosomal protein L10
MSKQIKQMQMDNLRATFQTVRELVLLSVSGLTCTADNQLRASLRKKNIHVEMVKNSLARRVFNELGMAIPKESPYWVGTTWMTWGPESVAELSQELERQVLTNKAYKDKIRVKGAITEGQPVPFDKAKTLPTRPQAIAAVLAAILGPAQQIAGQIIGPASQIAGQIQTLSEKAAPEGGAPEGGAPPADEPAPAPA